MKGNLALVTAVTLALAFPLSGLAQAPAGLATATIEQASGLKAQLIAEENVFKVGKPRTGVKINVNGWPVHGLGSWAAFTPTHGGVMLMRHTVLFEDGGNLAMSAALEPISMPRGELLKIGSRWC